MMDFPAIDTLWNYDFPEETEEKFRQLLPLAQQSGDIAYFAELLTQLARTYSLQGKFEKAHQTLDLAEPMIADGSLIIPRVRYLLERGRTFNSAMLKEKAIAIFKEAYEEALNHEADYYAIDAAHMLGIAEKSPAAQLHWNMKAVEMAEKSPDPKSAKWLGSLYNNIGWIYHGMKDFPRALDMFKKSLKWRENQNDHKGISIAKWCVGRVYRSINQIDDALDIQHALLKEAEEKNLPPDGYVYEEIAECLLVKSGEREAKKYFRLAHDILSKDEWFKTNEAERLERLNLLGS